MKFCNITQPLKVYKTESKTMQDLYCTHIVKVMHAMISDSTYSCLIGIDSKQSMEVGF